MKGPSPLLGYNTNVRHGGKLFHIQTEDSGLKHPHIITHLFADGGRIIASKKTGYAEIIGDPKLQDLVKKMMRDQHKGMFIALRDGEYDQELDITPAQKTAGRLSDKPPPVVPDPAGAPTPPGPAAGAGVDALERAAARLAATASSRPPAGKFQSTRPAQTDAVPQSTGSIFGSDLLSEKSLDEVILSYLAEDLEEDSA